MSKLRLAAIFAAGAAAGALPLRLATPEKKPGAVLNVWLAREQLPDGGLTAWETRACGLDEHGAKSCWFGTISDDEISQELLRQERK